MMEASGLPERPREHDTRRLHAWRRGSWAGPSNGLEATNRMRAALADGKAPSAECG